MTAYFERFQITMTRAQAKGASHPGPCDDDIDFLLKMPSIKRQLAKIPDDVLASELREYGAWLDDDLADRELNEARIVWIAACNITENGN